ncbi:hypothetical protein AVEN_29266-1 [Araneus ventricosus]|uniref:Reverse transcriptase domain-containing protein n=1 Tax=Araneus ventricosus TaxID=182803 RepID=A0A4Y2IQ58_ARAVE|nr:hypothetical protein AVEN_29266-1 [Araneus ventricosus]
MFNIFANDFPSIRNCITCLGLSADDTVIMSTGASEIMEDLNSYLDQLAPPVLEENGTPPPRGVDQHRLSTQGTDPRLVNRR